MNLVHSQPNRKQLFRKDFRNEDMNRLAAQRWRAERARHPVEPHPAGRNRAAQLRSNPESSRGGGGWAHAWRWESIQIRLTQVLAPPRPDFGPLSAAAATLSRAGVFSLTFRRRFRRYI